MTITIDQSTFEKYIPAFINPDDEIFSRLSAKIEDAEKEVLLLVGDAFSEAEANTTISEQMKQLICIKAARRAVPHLDLVLTSTGFGIVSNQNVAPASRDRIQNLLEQLRQDESNTHDYLLDNLLTTSWKTSEQAINIIHSLFWCPMVTRRYGVRSAEGKDLYNEEWLQLLTKIKSAEESVKVLISPELFDAIIALQRTGNAAGIYNLVIEQARILTACKLMNKPEHDIDQLSNRLMDTINRNEDALSEYKNSSTYEANQTARFENTADGTAFFFS